MKKEFTNESAEKMLTVSLSMILFIVFVVLAISSIGLIHALIRDWRNDPKNEYNFCSTVLAISDNTYAVVSDEGNVFTFISPEKIPDNMEVRVFMDKGTDLKPDDDTINRIELLFCN